MTLFYPTCYPLLTRTSSPPTKLDESNDKYKEWSATHIDKFLRCIFGSAQYKVCAVYCVSMSIFFVSKPVSDLRTYVGTDLWATEDKGMIRAPDFGRILTKDRFYPNPIPMPTLDLNPYANRNLPSI
jgi:hypothetical protein